LKKIVVAIDGPAGAGKSSTARAVADALGYVYIDTGAMYRAITLKIIERKISENDIEAIRTLLASTFISFQPAEKTFRVLLDNKEVTNEIRSHDVTNAVSAISALECVRTKMVEEQRRLGKEGGVVVEGRDIGTVVFPKAEVKIFLIASEAARTKRRQKELQESGILISDEDLQKQIHVRDTKDSGRRLSPLTKADDAIELDTTNMTFAQQVEFIVTQARNVIKSKE